jgi:hypothetical protein
MKTKEEIIELEKSLYDTNQRYNRDFLTRILHQDFIEESCLGNSSKNVLLNQIKFTDTSFKIISEIKYSYKDNFVTLEYLIEKTHGNKKYLSNRISIWIIEDNHFLLYRHSIKE